ncbi:anti-sigma factor [Flavobacterium sp. CAU 1735]|uniref:anti-sigma factor n=1 Tax=Flavobacterium sp. CAU 1735 TaxID=3140361 RepID=UPI0032614F25
MNTREYIESGVLELYIFGKLSESENQEVQVYANEYPEIKQEIESIEKAIINLSYSVAPNLSLETFNTIRKALLERETSVVTMQPKSNKSAYLGWAASFLLLLGAGFLYFQMNQNDILLKDSREKNQDLQKSVVTLEEQNKNNETLLNLFKDENNKVVALAGQAVAPEAKAKIYWNQNDHSVYVDASGLPEPPKGHVYQVWSLKMDPLTPTSIGLLEKTEIGKSRIFKVDNATDAEGFGITLEPAGGSAAPTLEQLYTLGKV